jgi:ATP-binding cassette subfamily F protein 3
MVHLSGGQKSRVAFTLLSLQTPHILVLDEPTNHLDIAAMDALMQAVTVFRGGVLIVSHDVTFIQKTCDLLWVCEEETVKKFDGTVDMYKKRVLAQAGQAGVVMAQ